MVIYARYVRLKVIKHSVREKDLGLNQRRHPHLLPPHHPKFHAGGMEDFEEVRVGVFVQSGRDKVR